MNNSAFMVDLERLNESVRSNTEALCRDFFSRGRKSVGEWKIADYGGIQVTHSEFSLPDPKPVYGMIGPPAKVGHLPSF